MAGVCVVDRIYHHHIWFPVTVDVLDENWNGCPGDDARHLPTRIVEDSRSKGPIAVPKKDAHLTVIQLSSITVDHNQVGLAIAIQIFNHNRECTGCTRIIDSGRRKSSIGAAKLHPDGAVHVTAHSYYICVPVTIQISEGERLSITPARLVVANGAV